MRMNIPTKVLLPLVLVGACATAYGGLQLGNDSGEYPLDGECDDPRFAGGGMASSLDTVNILADASDCARLLEAGLIRPQRTRDQWDPAQCQSVRYGNNSSDWAHDGQCDDPRFTGPGVDSILNFDDQLSDASDCRALCDAGEVWPK